MIIEHFVNSYILNYPITHRKNNHRESRLQALNSIFCNFGTGLYWNKEGFLEDRTYMRVLTPCRKTLPKDFYQKELYDFEIPKKVVPCLRADLRKDGIWHYVFKTRYYARLLVEASEGHAQELFDEYSERTNRPNKSICNRPFSPSDISQYSPIHQMTVNQTDNGPLEFIKEDWLKAAVEVVEEAVDYYNDESRFSSNHYHHTAVLHRVLQAQKYEPDQFKRYCEVWQVFTPEEIEGQCKNVWEEYLSTQKEYCQKFLEKYK